MLDHKFPIAVLLINFIQCCITTRYVSRCKKLESANKTTEETWHSQILLLLGGAYGELVALIYGGKNFIRKRAKEVIFCGALAAIQISTALFLCEFDGFKVIASSEAIMSAVACAFTYLVVTSVIAFLFSMFYINWKICGFSQNPAIEEVSEDVQPINRYHLPLLISALFGSMGTYMAVIMNKKLKKSSLYSDSLKILMIVQVHLVVIYLGYVLFIRG